MSVRWIELNCTINIFRNWSSLLTIFTVTIAVLLLLFLDVISYYLFCMCSCLLFVICIFFLWYNLHLECTRLNSTSGGPRNCETSIQKQYEWCADTTWNRYGQWPQLTFSKDLHWTEENHKLLKAKTRMGSGEVICSVTATARFPRRKTCAVEFENAVEQYQEMCVRYYEWFGCEGPGDSKKAMDYTANEQ